jgi:uncharacterized membrane protein YgcG
MKNMLKQTGLVAVVTIVALYFSGTACTQTGKIPKRDTLFVEVSGDNIDSSLLKKVYGDTVQPGEFVSANYTLRIPLIPKDHVNDYINLFTPAQIATLDSLIMQYEKKTTNQVAIITIDNRWIKVDSFESFITKVHNVWGIGQKDKNNGILIGICPGHRKMRISNGYGIEKVFTDEDTKKVIDSFILPEYKKGNYFEGTRNGLQAIMMKVGTIK